MDSEVDSDPGGTRLACTTSVYVCVCLMHGTLVGRVGPGDPEVKAEVAG
jgi:hypothetical protein